jgi:hypothetical protein
MRGIAMNQKRQDSLCLRFRSFSSMPVARYGLPGIFVLIMSMLMMSCIGGKVTVDIDPSAPGAVIPDDFLGISVEWSGVTNYLGDGAGGVKPAAITLMQAFEAEGHRISVRIGGNSQDRAWWNPTGEPRPSGVTIDIGQTHLDTLAAVAEILNTRLILGLNLVLNDPVAAANLVNAAYGTIPHDAVQAFELGNEPDLYRIEGHRRGLGYGWHSYIEEMDTFRDGIAALVPQDTPFAGPSLANRSWILNMEDFFARENEEMALVTTHIYPFTNCYDMAPSPESLLTSYATSGIGASYKPVADAARSAGMPYRMDEMNSVSCGGADGVSNVYASALWGADIAFQLAEAGLDGINFHTPSNYAVFLFDGAGAPVVRPLYYGMRFFSLATAKHGRLLPVKVKTPANVHAWATLGDDGAVRVALINLNQKLDVTISLRLPGMSETASVVRMQAPSLTSRDGLTLGGLTWDGSVDGRPLGNEVAEQVIYDKGSYSVLLPALQAVILTAGPAL